MRQLSNQQAQSATHTSDLTEPIGAGQTMPRPILRTNERNFINDN